MGNNKLDEVDLKKIKKSSMLMGSKVSTTNRNKRKTKRDQTKREETNNIQNGKSSAHLQIQGN